MDCKRTRDKEKKMTFHHELDIDSLKHKKIAEKPVKYYDGDYKNLSIQKPPLNSSQETKNELKKMKDMFKDRSPKIEQSVKDHDNEVSFAIKKYLDKNNLKYSLSDISKIVEVGSGIGRYFKNKFERPRPYQLADAMHMDFDHMNLDSDSMKSPSYPSGHSLQSRLVAEYYIEKYPDHKEGLIKAANECGTGRVYAGWHFMSDHNAGVNLAKKIYSELNLNESISESIIDIPKKTYAKGVFNDADTENPKLKPGVVAMIKSQIKKFEQKAPVLKFNLIGSILTKRYREDADLDVNVLFDVEPSYRETMRQQLASDLKSVNGKLIPGTKHPINYYVITDPKIKVKADKEADGVFDIEENKFSRKPKPITFDPKQYESDFRKKVEEIDVIRGELVRDIIDYKELKELTQNDVDGIQKLVKDKLEEIEETIKMLVDMGDETVKQRQDAFARQMTPDEIRKYGIKNKLPKNVIYKMLEKYHYSKLYAKCKKIMDDGKVTDAEINDLSEMSRRGRYSVYPINAFRILFPDAYRKLEKIFYPGQYKNAVRDYISGVLSGEHQGVERYSGGVEVKSKDSLISSIVSKYKNVDTRMLRKHIKDLVDKGTFPKHMLPEELEINEAPKKTIVFAWGRFNPPTIGHEKLLDRVARVSANEMRIYISKSNDPKKNPLNPRQKLDYMKKIFPRYARKIMLPRTNVVLDIITDLYKEGFTDLKMVAGSDRIQEFKKLFTTYNDVKSRHGYYNFDSIEVINAGERDPDAEGAMGMSASKMRAAAKANDLKSFEKGLPNFRGIEKLFKDVRRGMNLAASYTTGLGHMNYRPIASLKEFEQKQIRDMYIREMLFNIGDRVENVNEDIIGVVTRRGTNYVVLEDNKNNLYKSWIWDCIPVPPDREIEIREHDLNVDYGFKTVREEDMQEDLDAQPQDKDVKKKKGTQPKKYYKTLKKDVKKKRADYFAKQKYRKSDDDDDYKPAPGDKTAKTKPSIHTKKYKQMYGETKLAEKGPCWSGYKQVGMKNKGGKQVPNCVPEEMSIEDAMRVDGYIPESYEEGEDYANHAKEITPGEKADKKPMDSKKRTPENRITADDVKEWALQDETIDKYRSRYGDEWRSKLLEVTKKMMDKINENF